MYKKITVLGSTGSIGTQSLDVARENGFKIHALAAGANYKLLETQVREFKPRYAALFSEDAAKELKTRIADTATTVLCGEDGVCEIAANSNGCVVNGIVGIAGLKPTLCAINSKNDVALANKETLVTAGDIVMAKATEKKVKILPVDSEHSAIFQCLQGVPDGSLRKILLTASGGPFFGKTAAELKNVTPQMALKHPNWEMGAKITIDSATMMNKGLEVIEAMHLFGVSARDIEILVHRESIVHSAVELSDGAVIAQLGTPDMRLPIQYALTYPKRIPCPSERLSLADVAKLTFFKPDTDAFLCLKACIKAADLRGLKPAAANGANELANLLFRQGKIGFTDIGELVSGATDSQKHTETYSLSDVFNADAAAREYVKLHI